jgi:hypothetical protein
MRSFKTTLPGLVIAGVLGTIAVIGCTADGGAIGGVDPTTNTAPTDPGLGGGNEAKLPEGSGDDDPLPPAKDGGSTKPPAPKPDSGTKPPAPPAPDEGAACAQVNQVFTRACGFCGKQEAICLAGEDAGANHVSPYGVCTGSVVGGCTPGATETRPCGDCGNQVVTCNQYCAFPVSAVCNNQPVDHCTPGATEFLSAGCPADKWRQKSCKTDCTWNNVSATCESPPTFVLAPPTAGGVNSTIMVLSQNKTTTRMSLADCPLSATATIGPQVTPYTYIEVRNPGTKPVKVSLFHSQAPNGPIIDTIINSYDGATIPTTTTARKACTKNGDYGTTSLTGNSEFASIDGTDAVTIPAGGSIQVYNASYPEYSASNPSNSTGMIKFNVKTEEVLP